MKSKGDFFNVFLSDGFIDYCIKFGIHTPQQKDADLFLITKEVESL